MFLDSLLLLSDAQAFTATGFSTNTIDLGNVTPKNEIGAGEPMEVTVTVDVAADFTSTDETYRFDLVTSANANLSSPTIINQRSVLASGGAASLLAAGRDIHLPVPKGAVLQRYLGLQLTLAGTTPSITITAMLQPQSMDEARKDYAKGYTIS